MIGSTIYLSGREVDTGAIICQSNSCSMCKRMIINAGIVEVVYHQRYSIDATSMALLAEAGVKVRPVDEEED